MTTQQPTYRAAIIGLGFIGAGDQVSGDALGQQVANLDGTHAQALTGHPRISLVAGSSRDDGRRERFAARTGCRTYADWREMLEREELDIVSVATYAPTHAEMTIACAERKIRAVYCEKPIACRVSDADAMVRACAEADTLLVINHNRRFNPNYRRLRDYLKTGKLGELTSLALHWGSGRLGNVGTHLIDAACMVADRKVCAVSGTLDLTEKADCRGAEFHDPGGFGWLRLEGGLMASVDAPNYGPKRVGIIIRGTEGVAYTGGDEVAIELDNGEREHWPSLRDGATSMARAVGEMVDALDGVAPFPGDPRHSVDTLEAIAAFHLSHARNAAWVELPLQGADRDFMVQTA